MEELNRLLNELGISKVRLSKYLGVSRQMLYNYLALETLDAWPKEKKVKVLDLLGASEEAEFKSIVVDSSYITSVEDRLNEGVKTTAGRGEVYTDLKGFSRKEQELLSNIINLLKEKLSEDKTKNTYNAYNYLYHFIQSMDNTEELKYILGYASKSLGFTEPLEFVFNKDKQLIFESILFSAMTLYNNGGASRNKIADTHKRFVEDINHKKEEKLSRTQELNTAKIQALKELGYTEINESNAKEVLEKIAEIQSRKV